MEQSTSYNTPPEMHKQTVVASLDGPRIFLHGIGGGGWGAVSANTRSFGVFFFSYGIICCFLGRCVGAVVTLSLYATFGLGHNISVN